MVRGRSETHLRSARALGMSCLSNRFKRAWSVTGLMPPSCKWMSLKNWGCNCHIEDMEAAHLKKQGPESLKRCLKSLSHVRSLSPTRRFRWQRGERSGKIAESGLRWCLRVSCASAAPWRDLPSDATLHKVPGAWAWQACMTLSINFAWLTTFSCLHVGNIRIGCEL